LQLKLLAEQFGTKKVYDDFVKVYDRADKQVSKDKLEKISLLSKNYGRSASQADIIFSILYMVMIAEERKAGTRLGKRIKRLGIYRLLIENMPVHKAANFMRGMN